jgi:hypothetical protein
MAAEREKARDSRPSAFDLGKIRCFQVAQAVVELFRADRSSFQLEKEVITGRRIVPQEETRRSSFKSRKEDGFHHLASNPASKFVELGTWRRKRFRTRTWRRQSLPKNRRTRSSAV